VGEIRSPVSAEALLPQIAALLRNSTASSHTGEAIVTSADAGRYQLRDASNQTTQTRIGTGIGTSFELIIDPNTTRILATEYVDKGQVSEYAVNVSQGVVNSVQ
jgi:hypothetical protein